MSAKINQKLFGTDGIRGLANQYPVTPELAFRLGKAGASYFGRRGHRSRIVVGRDTRLSGQMLEGALLAGVSSAGGDVLRVGVLPTPAIAWLTRHYKADAGVVISASHNSFEDNGIKFFSPVGEKLSDAAEARLEALTLGKAIDRLSATGAAIGRVLDEPQAAEAYCQMALESVPASLNLRNLHIVVDCGHGATYFSTPEVLRRLGARVTVLHDLPDGRNINADCGSTYPQAMQEAVVRLGADLGLAHDGDGDRVLLADERGQLVDGDRMVGLCAIHYKARRELSKNLVVGTVMSNLGLELALQERGITLLRAAVGDRYVLQQMKRRGAILGGEQSGHVIFRRHLATGDGLITALQVLRVMKETGKLLTELAGFMVQVPQVLINVRVARRVDLDSISVYTAALKRARVQLKGRGRVLVRYSGTEPKVRVMVEGLDSGPVNTIAQSLADLLKRRLG